MNLSVPNNLNANRLIFSGFFALCILITQNVYANDENEQKSVEQITKDMLAQTGLLDLYYETKTGKVYLRVPNANNQYIFQTSLPRGVGSNDIGLDRGQLGETRLVSFERYGGKVLLKQHNTKYRASANSVAEKLSVDEAFADSVIAGFKLVAEDESSWLIDYTNYIFSDVHDIQQRLSRTKQGAFSVDKNRSAVYPQRTKSFAQNTELEAVITFAGSSPGSYVKQVTPDPNSITVHLHHSFIALPDEKYIPRQFHPYSGFWEHSYYDYSVPISENMEQQVIVRHRLKKKDPTAKVSEAVEPIVYYLDPGIPEPVFSALKEGALWWDQAFTAIGYKNAFQVKVLPEDADPMDVRYNVIQWVHRATRGWSYGTSVVDPRTGELIKGHVTLGSLRVRQDYLIGLGLTSPFGKKPYDTSPQSQMALNRIKQLSAHEVGHTLGIAHNFAASESDRASVMDYPHPKITLKRGKISLDDAYDDGIGEWDKWVINYGYQDYPESTNEDLALAQVIVQMRESGIAYKSDPDSRSARHGTTDGHLWDNGKEPIAEFDHLSAVRRVALQNFGLNTLAEGENLSFLTNRLAPIYLLHRFQIDAVAKQLGGIEYSYEQKIQGAAPKGAIPVSANKQKDALERLIVASTADFLALPKSLVDLIPPLAYGDQPSREDFSSRTGRVFDPITAAESVAFKSLTLALDPQRLGRLNIQHSNNASIPNSFSVTQTVLERHWNTYDNAPLAVRLRHVALQAVFGALADEEMAPEVHQSILAVLVEFEQWLQNDAQSTGYPASEVIVLRRHFDYFWKHNTWPVKYMPQPLPPGSPI